MGKDLSPEQIQEIGNLFRLGRTYVDISRSLGIPMSQVTSVLCCENLFRDQIMARRIVMNQMAAEGVYVEEIAATVGLKLDTVKNHLRKSRVKYLLTPKEGQQ